MACEARQRKRRRPGSLLNLPFKSLLFYTTAILFRESSDAYLSYPTFTRTITSLSMVENYSKAGLSRRFQNILQRSNSNRQSFVTGKYPVIVSLVDNPTQKWLNKEGATSLLLVNNTILSQSLASLDRFHWFDDRDNKEDSNCLSIELLAEIYIPKPGYLQILPRQAAGWSAERLRKLGGPYLTRWRRSAIYEEVALDYRQADLELHEEDEDNDRLWVTGFSLAGRKGIIKSMDVDSGHIESINQRSEAMTLWPNEVNNVPSQLGPDHPNLQSFKASQDDAILVSDGFLVPGKDRGGIYVVKHPGNPISEWATCLTNRDGDRWFYHRAIWVDLTGDGRRSILTARAKLRKVSDGSEEGSRPKNGQLIMLEMPKPHHYDERTGTPLEEDGTAFDPFSARHLPWKERILATGPDVMFSVADMDAEDDSIEVIASQFFDKKVSLHSIRKGPEPRVTFSRIIDDRCGASFGGILADLDPTTSSSQQVIDAGSTVASLTRGDSFSHILVTSHECNYAEAEQPQPNGANSKYSIDGGSVFSYRVPSGRDAWKTEPWTRTTVATGFKVKGQIWNVINPGAPGFVYTFHANKQDEHLNKRPLIAVAGDCAESAYIFRPHVSNDDVADPQAQYKLMTEIKCDATVGSIAIGYDNLCDVEQESGYAKIYIPCYEKDKILVFALGSGKEHGDDGWFSDEN